MPITGNKGEWSEIYTLFKLLGDGRVFAGDGNMHPTIVCDIRDEEEMKRVHQAMDVIFRGAVELGGTLSGEHGIGLGKLPWMELQHGKEGMNAMKAIKRALDPNLILNPGKLIGEC